MGVADGRGDHGGDPELELRKGVTIGRRT